MNFDVALAISKGKRDYQEDAVSSDFILGNRFGFAVLADGMGGHAAGDIASKIVVTEVFSELKLQTGDIKALEDEVVNILTDAAKGANSCIKAHVAETPAHRGMGATLLAPVIFANRLYWISIGDSPLFLFRKSNLQQLNDDHSMAPLIDIMVKTGQMDAETARNHPDRNSLTSVIMGKDIPAIDCKGKPVRLETADIVIAASDGLQFLENKDIAAILNLARMKSSNEIANALMSAIVKLKHPDQDNISMVVIKIV